MHPSGSPSQELDEVAEAKESDVDEEEGGVFDKEDVAEDSESGDFGGASETLDGMVVVGGEKVSEDNGMPGMRDNVASVRNSQDFGVEPVPIMQEEPSINDSVSSMIKFDITTYHITSTEQ